MNTLREVSLGKVVASTRYPFKSELVEYAPDTVAFVMTTEMGVLVVAGDTFYLNDVLVDGSDETTYLDCMSKIGLAYIDVDGELVYTGGCGDYKLTVSKDRKVVTYNIDGRTVTINHVVGLVTITNHETTVEKQLGDDYSVVELYTLLFRWADDLYVG